MSANVSFTRTCDNNPALPLRQNKANSNPISEKAKNERKLIVNKGLPKSALQGRNPMSKYQCPSVSKPAAGRAESPHLRQCASQCYRPAGSDNNYEGQNYMSHLNLSKKTLQKRKMNANNSYEQAQNRCESHDAAEKCGGRLRIERRPDSPLREGKHRRSHPARRARQPGFMLKPAVAKQQAQIQVVAPCHPEEREKGCYRYENNRRHNSLPRRSTVENFRSIWLLD
jgi:hypothetical protein